MPRFALQTRGSFFNSSTIPHTQAYHFQWATSQSISTSVAKELIRHLRMRSAKCRTMPRFALQTRGSFFNSIAILHSKDPLQIQRPATLPKSSSNPALCHTPRRLTFNGPPHKAIAQALLKSWYAISGCAAQNAEQCRGLHCKPGVRSSIPAPYRTPRLITSNGPPHKALAQALLKS